MRDQAIRPTTEIKAILNPPEVKPIFISIRRGMSFFLASHLLNVVRESL